jgi:hypothetical protein
VLALTSTAVDAVSAAMAHCFDVGPLNVKRPNY